MHTFRTVTGILLAVSIAWTSLFNPSFSPEAHALAVPLGGLDPFGGLVYFIWPCSCQLPLGWALVVSPPVPTSTAYLPGVSILYMYHMPITGAWVLGQERNGVCRFWVGKICLPFPVRGSIYHVGTSVPGADLVGPGQFEIFD